MNMKTFFIINFSLLIALCAFAQDKGGSAPVEYSVRSAIGRPIVGVADDGAPIDEGDCIMVQSNGDDTWYILPVK